MCVGRSLFHQHADQPPGRNRRLQQRLRDTLNHLVVVTHNAHVVANSIINEAVDNVLSYITAPPNTVPSPLTAALIKSGMMKS